MPLNLSVNDGEFTPYLKYNAKAGRWYIRPQGQTVDVEIDRPRFAVDMAHIRTGWLFYQEGAGPEKVWDPSPAQEAARPPGPRKFKRGFEVMIYGNDEIPGVGKLGLREFSSTAGNVIASILRMHDDYEKGMAANPNAVPFYVCTGVVAMQGAYGTNYEPQFRLSGWVARSKIPDFDKMIDDGAIGWDNEPPPARANIAPNARDRAADDRQAPQGQPTPPAAAYADLDDEIPF
jgi:hypothetical protein